MRPAPGSKSAGELHPRGASADSPEPDSPSVQRATTVLVVDDERAVRAIVAAGLEALGHRVLVAASGREACELYCLHRGAIDLVLLDLTMPEMSGEETLQALREQNEAVRALVMTGYAEDDLRDHVAEQAFAGFLSKPFSRQELLSAVTAALGPRSL